MKRMIYRTITLLTIVFILNRTDSLTGQTYTPLVVDQSTWVIGHAPESFSDTDFYAYRIEGDTLINNILYAKVYRYELQDNTANPYIAQGKNLYAYLREDINNRKVYVIGVSDNSFAFNDQQVCLAVAQAAESLLFDFDKSLGDPLSDCVLVEADYNTNIVNVDEPIIYGAQRRVFENQNALKLIEGIGYDDGLFVPAESFVHSAKGHTMFDFCIGSFADCGLITSISNIIFDESLKIYPNPTLGIINIETDLNVIKVELYNTIGEKVMIATTTTMDVSSLKAGNYHFKLITKDGVIIEQIIKM